MTHTFAREELHHLVWSEPMRSLAKRYEISDVGLAKACKKADIPRPPRGYWNKLKAGNKVARLELPPRGLGKSRSIIIGGNRFEQQQIDPDKLKNQKLERPRDYAKALGQIMDEVRAKVKRVTVSNNLDHKHYLIRDLLEVDEERRKKCVGQRWAWDEPKFETTFEKRRLRILNAMFLALSRVGAKPSLRGKDGREIHIVVGDYGISIEIDDPAQMKRTKQGYGLMRELGPKMKLEISSWMIDEEVQCIWEDGKDGKIEKHLTEIVVSLLMAGEIKFRNGEQQRYEWLVERQQAIIEAEREAKLEAVRLEEERKRKEEQARIDKLIGDANNLRLAKDIRAYVREVEALYARADIDISPAELDSWSQWAINHANRTDPVRSRAFLLRK